MNPFFEQLRESASKVMEGWADNNKVVVDHASAEVVFLGSFRGLVRFQVMTFGGHAKKANASFELNPAREEMLVFAQGACVERFSMQPYQLEWNARTAHACRQNQGLHVCNALWKNAERRKASCRPDAPCEELGCPKCRPLSEDNHHA